jgi:hypothetical protein
MKIREIVEISKPSEQDENFAIRTQAYITPGTVERIWIKAESSLKLEEHN